METVMERDLRITGKLRGQSGNAEAPKGFEVSNPWRVRTTSPSFSFPGANNVAAREEDLLDMILPFVQCPRCL